MVVWMKQNQQNIRQYKQNLTTSWNQRKNYDDTYRYHRAFRLLELTQLKPRQKILDVATGTGIIALKAAQLVGSSGSVLGIDMSAGMLQQAHQKLAQVNLKNVELREADAEALKFNPQSFDVILISSALMWLSDIPTALNNYHQWLKVGGKLAFSCYTENSFLIPLAIKVGAQFGFSLPNCNATLGSLDKIKTLLKSVGFEQISIESEKLGSYLTPHIAKGLWHQCIEPHKDFLSKISTAQLAQMKVAYEAEIDAQTCPKGFWQEIVIFYVISNKSLLLT